MRREIIYWLCQVWGWGALLAAELFLISLNPSAPPGQAQRVAWVSAAGLMASHLLRLLIHQAGWRDLGRLRLVPRVLAAAGILGLVLATVGGYVAPWATGIPVRFEFADFLNVAFFGSWLGLSWLALYFGTHYLETADRQRKERLELVSVTREVELRALKSQLDPHFMFNSLNDRRAGGAG